MSLKARVGDTATGTCIVSGSTINWSGTVTGGSGDVMVNGTGDARNGDTVSTDCPQCSTCHIIQGSSSVLVNGLETSRLGAVVVGPSSAKGTIVSSSPNVLAGG